jgi:hypothetical protein
MSREDWISIAKGAAIAAGGALLTFAADVLIPAMHASGTPVLLGVAVVASVAINVVRKWMTGQNG